MSLTSYIVTLKESTTNSQLSSIKDHIASLGGEVTSEFSLIKGFVAKLPEIHTDSVKKQENVLSVEVDGEVKTQ